MTVGLSPLCNTSKSDPLNSGCIHFATVNGACFSDAPSQFIRQGHPPKDQTRRDHSFPPAVSLSPTATPPSPPHLQKGQALSSP